MVSLKASHMVKPAEQTPQGIMYLSYCDQTKAVTHAPTVYFYQKPAEFPSTINILKDSLSKVLVTFYPLAGRLRSLAGGRLELDCNSMGAQFLVAESEAKIDDFGDFRPTPELRALIPSVDYTTPIQGLPILLVQLTKFSCGGVSLGLGLSHILVDGESAAHFVDEWTKVARGEQTNSLPFLDRKILQSQKCLPSPSFDHSEYSPLPLLIGQSDTVEERKKASIIATLKLSKEEIEKLKGTANEGRGSHNGDRSYSRYEAVAAHIWRCASKARRHVSQQLTRLCMAVGFRNRMNPPLPKCYFGNAIIRAGATTTSGELLSKPLGYASSKIREAVEMVTDEYVRSSLSFVENQDDVAQYRSFNTLGCNQGAFYGNPNIDITSWVRLPLYGTDFGWGKEIYMGPGALGYDGKTYILPGHDNESFIITLRLQVDHMVGFKKFFYGDI